MAAKSPLIGSSRRDRQTDARRLRYVIKDLNGLCSRKPSELNRELQHTDPARIRDSQTVGHLARWLVIPQQSRLPKLCDGEGTEFACTQSRLAHTGVKVPFLIRFKLYDLHALKMNGCFQQFRFYEIRKEHPASKQLEKNLILFVRLKSTTTLLSGVTGPELSLCKADFLLPLLNLLSGFNDIQPEPLRKFSQRHQLIKRGFPCEMPEPAELFPGVDDF